jgi:hypothetical protein
MMKRTYLDDSGETSTGIASHNAEQLESELSFGNGTSATRSVSLAAIRERDLLFRPYKSASSSQTEVDPLSGMGNTSYLNSEKYRHYMYCYLSFLETINFQTFGYRILLAFLVYGHIILLQLQISI